MPRCMIHGIVQFLNIYGRCQFKTKVSPVDLVLWSYLQTAKGTFQLIQLKKECLTEVGSGAAADNRSTDRD